MAGDGRLPAACAGGGLVDELVFDVPDGWNGPYKVTPPATLKSEKGPAGQNRIVVQPARPSAADSQLTFSAAIALPAIALPCPTSCCGK